MNLAYLRDLATKIRDAAKQVAALPEDLREQLDEIHLPDNAPCRRMADDMAWLADALESQEAVDFCAECAADENADAEMKAKRVT